MLITSIFLPLVDERQPVEIFLFLRKALAYKPTPMKKWISFALIFIVASSVLAQDMESLKKRHEELLQDQGDIRFVEGEHYFVVSDNVLTSIFSTEKEKCVYSEWDKNEFYRIISATQKRNSVTLSFSDQVIQDQVAKTVNYEICFQAGERLHGYHVIVDESSDLTLNKTDWAKLVSCVLKHAPELYKQVKTCIKSKKFMQCLKIIGPGINVYKCMKGKGVDVGLASMVTNEVSTQQLSFQTISFHWSWNYDTGLKTPPIYQEMPNPIIGFDSTKIIGRQNASKIRVSTSVIGNNVAKIELTNVSFALVPRFWSSHISGTVRCVMQR